MPALRDRQSEKGRRRRRMRKGKWGKAGLAAVAAIVCSLVATAVADYEVAEGFSEVPGKGDSSGWHQVPGEIAPIVCSFLGLRKICLNLRPTKRTPEPVPSQIRTIRDYTPWVGKRSGKYSPWKGKRDDNATTRKRNYVPWIGKRSGNPGQADADYRPKKFRPWAGKRSFDAAPTLVELSDTTPPMTPVLSKRSDKRDAWSRVLINGLLRQHPEAAERSDLVASLLQV